MSTAIANRPASSLAAVQPNGRLAGAEQSDFVLPRVHLFQGLPAEAKLYPGKHKAGDLINSLTFEKITGRKFVPLFGWKEWIKWSEERSKGIIYRTRIKSDVPPADLQWDRENNEPPAVTEYINFVVLFEGDESPVVLSFSRTQFKSGQTLHTLELLRGKKGPGLYNFDTRTKSNDKGEWLVPTIRPLGDPTPELQALAKVYIDSMNPADIDTNLADDEQKQHDAGMSGE